MFGAYFSSKIPQLSILEQFELHSCLLKLLKGISIKIKPLAEACCFPDFNIVLSRNEFFYYLMH